MTSVRSPLQLFHSVRTAYARAEESVGGHFTRDLELGGGRVRLEFAGPALAPSILPALSHTLTDGAPSIPDLTVYLWDSASTGVLPPPDPWTRSQVRARGEVSDLCDDRVLTAIQREAGALSMVDRERWLGVYRVDSAVGLPAYERAAPLKVLLHWWLRERGLPMIHAGAVGADDGGVLLVGQTGSGKSTAALACLDAGMQYVSDDRCLLSLSPHPEALCIYNSAKLHQDHMHRFPRLLPHVSNPDEPPPEKSLIFVQQFAPEQVVRRLSIRGILLAHIGGRRQTVLKPVSRMEVLRQVAMSSLIYQPDASHAEVRAFADLVRRLPSLRLELGTDLKAIPCVVAEAIRSMSSAGGAIS
ncbi:MAG: hypothetical protein GX620_15795 [Chloroflexi bacterium]|nr:hypothetical protein [Chloroflexota bacterium]